MSKDEDSKRRGGVRPGHVFRPSDYKDIIDAGLWYPGMPTYGLRRNDKRKILNLWEQGYSQHQIIRITGFNDSFVRKVIHNSGNYKRFGPKRGAERYTPWVDAAWDEKKQIGAWKAEYGEYGHLQIVYKDKKQLAKERRALKKNPPKQQGHDPEELEEILAFLDETSDEWYDCVCGLNECICEDRHA